MKIRSSLLFVLSFYLVVGLSQAQVSLVKNQELPTLSADEKVAFKKVINTMVKDLEAYISRIADKDELDQRRQDAIEQAVELFASADSNIVQVSSKIRYSITNVYVRRYFHRLYGIDAAKVDITFYDVARLDSLRRGEDGKYYGTAYIYQLTKIYFTEKNSPSPDYIDRTIKKIMVTLEPDDYWLRNENGPKFTAKLGDIKVEETR